MSIQSTTKLKREEAVRMLISKRMETEEKRMRAILKFEIEEMTNEDIEDELESQFDNYLIFD